MHQPTDSFSDSPYLDFAYIDREKGFSDTDIYYGTSLQNLFMGSKTYKLNKRRWIIAKISTYEDTRNPSQSKLLVAEARSRRKALSACRKPFGILRPSRQHPPPRINHH